MEDSQYGKYITSILGIEEGDSYYWSYYINDEYASIGVSSCEIEENSVYSFKIENMNIEKGWFIMVNSLFMLGGAYNKNRKISIAFICGWIIYMILNYDFSLGYMFPLINVLVCLLVSISINLIKNKTLNTILSILSILIWSIVIDTICFFMYPAMTLGQDIFSYIFQGILFNYKYIISNIIVVCVINGIIVLKKYYD